MAGIERKMPDLGEFATFDLSPFCCACWRSCGRVESARGGGGPSDAAAGHGKSPPKRPSFACSTSLGQPGGQQRFLPRLNLSAPQTPRALFGQRDTNLCRPLPAFHGLAWPMARLIRVSRSS